MNKKAIKIVSALIVAALLILPLTVYARVVPQPHGIQGIVYMSDGVTEAPAGTSFSVNDTTNGFFIEGTTGAGPHNGWYSVSIDGEDGDTVILRAWNETHYGERTVILTGGDMRGIAILLNKTLGPEPPVTVFDTGAPDNPYPTIAGTHNGTLKPNVTIKVTSLFTYPCAGTGGHTEYARIWNSTSNATAKWEGYKEDWHNLSFSEPFTLVANETYNYTIITGSYPQIHHTKALQTANGWINCTEFTDANGKLKDWVPAIRLFVYYNK